MVRETRESHPRQSELIVTHPWAPHLNLAFLCLLVAVFMHRVPTLHVLFLLAAGAVIPGEVPPAWTLFVFFLCILQIFGRRCWSFGFTFSFYVTFTFRFLLWFLLCFN